MCEMMGDRNAQARNNRYAETEYRVMFQEFMGS